MRKTLLGILGSLALVGCNNKSNILDKVPMQYKARVEAAINAAGDNSSELISTLEAFRNDSEKF